MERFLARLSWRRTLIWLPVVMALPLAGRLFLVEYDSGWEEGFNAATFGLVHANDQFLMMILGLGGLLVAAIIFVVRMALLIRGLFRGSKPKVLDLIETVALLLVMIPVLVPIITHLHG